MRGVRLGDRTLPSQRLEVLRRSVMVFTVDMEENKER